MGQQKFRSPALDALREEPSVMDAPWEAPLKGLLRLAGGDDPNQIMLDPPALDTVASPLISIYKNAAGVPDKQLRQMATDRAAKNIVSTSPNMADGVRYLKQYYPRVLAHMDIIPQLSRHMGEASAHVLPPSGRVTRPVPMEISVLGDALAGTWGGKRSKEIMAHEAGHVAQALGNRHFDYLYRQANKLLGYHDNPFEQSARAIARKAGGNMVEPHAVNAMKQLETLTQVPPMVLARRANLLPSDVENIQSNLKKVLEHRQGRTIRPLDEPPIYKKAP